MVRPETGSCQLRQLRSVSEGLGQTPSWSWRLRLKQALKRNLPSGARARLQRRAARVRRAAWARKRPGAAMPDAAGGSEMPNLGAGDLVRIRSEEEIRATFDGPDELRGCYFMDGMWCYCGTVQWVFRSVAQFYDEQDCRTKTASGLVLLEGLVCEGTSISGPCDRSCFFFWREEWLEKIESDGPDRPKPGDNCWRLLRELSSEASPCAQSPETPSDTLE